MMTYPLHRLRGLPFEAQIGSSPKYTIQPSNSFEWRKIIFGMITSTGIKHAKTYTLRGGPSTKLGQRAVTPPLRAASPRVHRRREKVVGFEETQNRGESRVERNNEGGRPSKEAARGNGSQNANLPPLLAAHVRRIENGQPLQSSLTFAYGGQALPNNIGGNLPPNNGLKMPSHIGSYDGKGYPNNFLHLFEGAMRMQKWLMPVACHMFTYTLKDSVRIWWNSQKAGSILDYEDLKANFRSHFSQQKKFTKTHLVVHNIKQRENESTRAFITRYTDDTLQILGLHEDQ
ncbi:reverse transcriptase domain-containing protein [Tanacetum coccineum]|uniref:Reverse transcriptase domain-containing protein n=1 Tax=Tanacetum coccineum TaxID=301880 RepID=A0ABQ4YDC5_9ASTR